MIFFLLRFPMQWNKISFVFKGKTHLELNYLYFFPIVLTLIHYLFHRENDSKQMKKQTGHHINLSGSFLTISIYFYYKNTPEFLKISTLNKKLDAIMLKLICNLGIFRFILGQCGIHFYSCLALQTLLKITNLLNKAFKNQRWFHDKTIRDIFKDI